LHCKIVVVMNPFVQWSTVPPTNQSNATTHLPAHARAALSGGARRQGRFAGKRDVPRYLTLFNVLLFELQGVGSGFVYLTSWETTCLARASNKALYVMLNMLLPPRLPPTSRTSTRTPWHTDELLSETSLHSSVLVCCSPSRPSLGGLVDDV
jgi:hypothetical protein